MTEPKHLADYLDLRVRVHNAEARERGQGRPDDHAIVRIATCQSDKLRLPSGASCREWHDIGTLILPTAQLVVLLNVLQNSNLGQQQLNVSVTWDDPLTCEELPKETP